MRAPFAIVGAGMAGLGAAYELLRRGVEVELFDKGRSAGGRVATRRVERWQFDHGAQFFTVRDEAFAAVIAPLEAAGTVVRWLGPFRQRGPAGSGQDPRPDTERYVAVPGMSALPAALARGLKVECGQRVERLAHAGDGWWLRLQPAATGPAGAAGDAVVRGPFAGVIVTLPPAQTAALCELSSVDGPLAALVATQREALQPCLAAMVAFAAPVPEAAGGWFVADSILGWVAHDGGKPGRAAAPTYVLHGAPAWSRQHVDVEPQAAAAALLDAFGRLWGRPLPPVEHLSGHRWRYALAAAEAVPATGLFDPVRRLAVAGDGYTGGRVEAAWCSGVRAARQLLG